MIDTLLSIAQVILALFLVYYLFMQKRNIVLHFARSPELWQDEEAWIDAAANLMLALPRTMRPRAKQIVAVTGKIQKISAEGGNVPKSLVNDFNTLWRNFEFEFNPSPTHRARVAAIILLRLHAKPDEVARALEGGTVELVWPNSSAAAPG